MDTHCPIHVSFIGSLYQQTLEGPSKYVPTLEGFRSFDENMIFHVMSDLPFCLIVERRNI